MMTEQFRFRGRALSRGEWKVVGFTALYMLGSLAMLFRDRNAEFMFYFAVMCLLIAVVACIHFAIRLHVVSLWGLAIWGLAHMAGGLVEVPASWPTAGETRVLYNWWLLPEVLKFDQVVHAFGFGLVTWVCWQGLRSAFDRRGAVVDPSFGLLLLAALAGMGAGALNEVVEFAAFQMLPDTNVGDYQNTGWDLVANLAGSITAAVLIYTFDRRGRP